MAVNIETLAGLDLDAVFYPRGSTTARADTNLCYVDGGADIDIAQRYRAADGTGTDIAPADTGHKIMVGGVEVDARQAFRWLHHIAITSVTNNGPQYEGTMITLAVNYTGYGVSRFVWRSPAGTVLQDSGDPNYYLFSTSYTQTGTYSVEVFNAGNSVTGTTYVTVIEEVDPPTISIASNNSPRYIGQTVTITVTASNYDTLQWINPLGSSISGETGTTLSFTATTIDQTGTYKCRATNSGGYTDAEAFVSIDYPPTHSPTISAFSASPSSAHLLDTITFTLTASDVDGDLASYTITHYTGTTTVTAASGSLSGGGPTTVNPTYEIPVTNATNGTGNGFNVTVYDSGGRTATSSTSVLVSN